jgi:NitT/TauT family transport system permease protein
MVTGLWSGFLVLLMVGIVGLLGMAVWHHFSLSTVLQVIMLGLITASRVCVLIVICSLIWVPIGVWIGLRPPVAKIIQPLVQFLAAFPVNLLYPLVFVLIVHYDLSVNIWVTPLMILGVQWYVLFNVIAGAAALPKDLLQVADNLNLNVRLRWWRLILPGIFPFYMTGAITAVGGAWNASIAAEVVSWGNKTLSASGLGAYIAEYTAKGDFSHVGLGIGIMSILVLLLNRLLWRPLYVLAQSRFTLDA